MCGIVGGRFVIAEIGHRLGVGVRLIRNALVRKIGRQRRLVGIPRLVEGAVDEIVEVVFLRPEIERPIEQAANLAGGRSRDVGKVLLGGVAGVEQRLFDRR